MKASLVKCKHTNNVHSRDNVIIQIGGDEAISKGESPENTLQRVEKPKRHKHCGITNPE